MQQGIIDRTWHPSTIDDQFVFKMQDRRLAAFFVFKIVVAPLSQDIPEENAPLKRILQVLISAGHQVRFSRRFVLICG
jgi:hypothetical protein